MKSISKLLIALLLSTGAGYAQSKANKITKVKVWGNCGLCEATIEKAARDKNGTVLQWDKVSKVATISYNENKTKLDDVLKRVALAGYDNDVYRAPNDIYLNLDDCCQYDRPIKTMPSQSSAVYLHGDSAWRQKATMNAFSIILESYLGIKEGLVHNDASESSAQAKILITILQKTDHQKLATTTVKGWAEQGSEFSQLVTGITKSNDLSEQRKMFMRLSQQVYSLAKLNEFQGDLYYQHCPMFNNGKGANWLSKNLAVKNPYYGSAMMDCGKTLETVKGK
ncbi:DUF3347 domain-containing protein [Pedobacter sp. MC2016-05]|uniref:DUF3347 domain-containing protein n=1 Tax=Pedobacter sp. MC2016-05 TaxID=2994474 RepID=UPI0022483896|nr:DUF3347 domain-containing protein [Pedobacter sp. MC2016-05]MCX2475361.1 DUF3347 domain-containing protein [Pedobacter sp. MC2016-05]